jgi:hypothetical protein
MIDEVRSLYEAGYSVIPLSGKQPNYSLLPKDNEGKPTWEPFQKKRANLEQITKWFGAEKTNVGVICGAISGIVVIDIDPRNGGVVSEWLSKYPTDCFVITGNSGAHLYYRHPGGIVENIHPAKGVDIKGDGGYVVAPPSLHPETGRAYIWMGRGEPAPFPIELLNQKASSDEKSSDSWISSLIKAGARDGEKNDSIASLSGYLASKEIPKDVTLSLMGLWNKSHARPHDEKQLEITVNSVYKTKNRRTVTLSPSEVVNDDLIGPKSFRLQKFENFMAEYADAPVDWIVPGWMPDKTILFTVSAPSTYKTWLLIDLAVSVAMGGKFLGRIPCRMSGPVILIQQEDAHGQTAQRIEVIRQSKVRELISENGDDLSIDLPKTIPLYIHTDRQLKFDNAESLKGLAEQVEAIRPKVVILDPLYSAASTDDYMAKSVEQMFILKELRDKFGCSFVIAHHSNKGGSEDRQRAWGSQFLNAFLETGWQLYPKGKGQIKVKRHFKAADNPEETCLSFNIDTEKGFKYEVLEGLVDAENGDESEITETEAYKVDKDDLEELESQPKASEMDAVDEGLKSVKKGEWRIKNDVILQYLATQADWRSAAQIANDLKFELTAATRKLDKMVDGNLLKRKDEPRKRPGWKKSYKVKF